MNKCNDLIPGGYFIIKALEQGVQVIGLTRGDSTKPHHTENLDKGEVLVLQFTEKTSFVKVRGKAKIVTPFGVVCSGDGE